VKKPDRYRFSLQWGVETIEKVQAGELLESLGNRKSEFIVMAVAEYIRIHPESLSAGQKIKLVIQPNFTRDQIEAMLRNIIEEKMQETPPIARRTSNINVETVIDGPDVDEMLKNLELFS